mmetsp:Transcript_17117/g.39450  ORF Transcript_17117/g.39450 Transcript_17117/m.39450 type:complete len:201 (+) Transcript_17117:510-1112(+)
MALERPLPCGATTTAAARKVPACSAAVKPEVSTSLTSHTPPPLLPLSQLILTSPWLLFWPLLSRSTLSQSRRSNSCLRAATTSAWLATERVPSRFRTSIKRWGTVVFGGFATLEETDTPGSPRRGASQIISLPPFVSSSSPSSSPSSSSASFNRSCSCGCDCSSSRRARAAASLSRSARVSAFGAWPQGRGAGTSRRSAE